jgi:hypothetical protein
MASGLEDIDPTTVQYGKWVPIDDNKIAAGSFGTVLRVVDSTQPSHSAMICACKVEKPTTTKSQVHYELQIYNFIRENAEPRDLEYFLEALDAGTTPEPENFKFMVMSLAGEDLSKVSDYLTDTERRQVMVSCFEAVCAFHDLGFLHRDIKPSNFCMHPDGSLRVKIIDLGLAKKYLQEDGRHIDCVRKSTQLGTPLYASMFCGAYVQSSRRDDMISLVYTAVRFFGQRLPWHSTPEHIRRIQDKKEKKRALKVHLLKMKRLISPERVTRDCGTVSKPLAKILGSAMCLGFYEQPPYQTYIQLLQ